MDPNNAYTQHQIRGWGEGAAGWTLQDRDHLVGVFDQHEGWKDYDEYLFKDIDTSAPLIGLDFACGPGRNIARFERLFSRIDGVDISEEIIRKAPIWLNYKQVDMSKVNLYHCNGVDLRDLQSGLYDVVFSTIAMQHIKVYDIRYNYFKEFLRVLKSGGMISIQMGYDGNGTPFGGDYYDNTPEWLGGDVAVTSPDQIGNDLKNIGFIDFKYYIRTAVPGDSHFQAIFFNARKP